MQKSIFSIHNTGIAVALGVLLAMATGCSSDDGLPADANSGQNTEVVVQMPIKIALGGYGEDGQSGAESRALPPDIG